MQLFALERSNFHPAFRHFLKLMNRFQRTYSGWLQMSVLDRQSTKEAVLKLWIPELSDPKVICERHILQTDIHVLVKNTLFCLHWNLHEIYTKILILLKKQGHLSAHCLCRVRQITP